MPILQNYSTKAPKGTDKDKIKKETKKLQERMEELQELLYADGRYSLLLVLQGMDSSGKDGVTRNVFARCSPTGVKAVSLKKPTEEEFAHDFLWRIHKHAPAKGMVSVLVRSHYEDVLIQRVHKWVSEEHIQKRIQSINAFEELLEYDNNTIILKFYLHLSPERQLEKLQERLDDDTKNWKHNDGDWEERKLWDKYMDAYENVFDKCSIPWEIIPADQRWYRNYVALKKTVETLEKLDLKYPTIKK